MMDQIVAFIGKIPTTQGQFCIAWLLWLGTGVRYLTAAKWEPSYEWLGALLLLSGVSTAHFIGKRVTDTTYVAAKQGTPPPPVGTD